MDNVPTIHYKAGEVIIREGEPSNSVFLIVSGKVNVTKDSGKKQLLLATQGKNTIFGEMALVDSKRRSATVTAIEDTYCHKCNSLALIQEINRLDGELRIALQSMAKIIRDNNRNLASNHIISEGVGLIEDPTDDFMVMTREEIMSDEILFEVEKIKDSFIRSLFRVLMAVAFGNNDKEV